MFETFGVSSGTEFWSSTINQATSGDFGYLRGFISNRTNIMRIDGELDFGFSVRLVKDVE